MKEEVPYHFYSKATGNKVLFKLITEDNKVTIEILEPKFMRHLDSTYISLMENDIKSMVWSQFTMIVLEAKKEKDE